MSRDEPAKSDAKDSNLATTLTENSDPKILLAGLKKFFPNERPIRDFLSNIPKLQVQFQETGIIFFNQFRFSYDEFKIIFSQNIPVSITATILKFIFAQIELYRKKPDYNPAHILEKFIATPPISFYYSSEHNIPLPDPNSYLEIPAIFNALLQNIINWKDLRQLSSAHLTQAINTTTDSLSKKETWLQIIGVAKVLQFLFFKQVPVADYKVTNGNFVFHNQLHFNYQQLLFLAQNQSLFYIPLSSLYFLLYCVSTHQQLQLPRALDLKQPAINPTFEQAYQQALEFLKEKFNVFIGEDDSFESAYADAPPVFFEKARSVNIRMTQALVKKLLSQEQWNRLVPFLNNDNIANHLFPESNQTIIHMKYLKVLMWLENIHPALDEDQDTSRMAIAQMMIAWFPFAAAATTLNARAEERSTFATAWDLHQPSDTRERFLHDTLIYDLSQVNYPLAQEFKDVCARFVPRIALPFLNFPLAFTLETEPKFFPDPLPLLKNNMREYKNQRLAPPPGFIKLETRSLYFAYADVVFKIRCLEIFATITTYPKASTDIAPANASAGAAAAAAAAAATNPIVAAEPFIPPSIQRLVIIYCLWNQPQDKKELQNSDVSDSSAKAQPTAATASSQNPGNDEGKQAAGAGAAVASTTVAAMSTEKKLNYFCIAVRFFTPPADDNKTNLLSARTAASDEAPALTAETSILVAFVGNIAAKRAELQLQDRIGEFNDILNTCTSLLEILRESLNELCEQGILNNSTYAKINSAFEAVAALEIPNIRQMLQASQTLSLISLHQEFEFMQQYRSTDAYQALPPVIINAIDGAIGDAMPEPHYFASVSFKP